MKEKTVTGVCNTMHMSVFRYGLLGGVILVGVLFFIFNSSQTANTEILFSEVQKNIATPSSARVVTVSEKIKLPVLGSSPTENVKHSIPIEEVRQGCRNQDCIPSVDNPEFMNVEQATAVVPATSIGIALSYKGEERFYPFPMLETHELVNDVVAGDALLISYCPLCGTGIVFNRTVGDEVYEFGVSGMLWQSNLLMYNRAESLENRNLWSQVLGEAVIGKETGVILSVVTSDIMKFENWTSQHPNGKVLNTGTPRDPYRGEYYEVAKRFAPNFNEQDSVLKPDAYVYGILYADTYKAYPRDILPEGTIHDMISGEGITIENIDGRVSFLDSDGNTISDVEGFWFSWSAVHPETEVWSN